MALYAMFLYQNADSSHADEHDDKAAHDRYAESLAASGALQYAGVLGDAETTTSIRAGGLVDGPFLEAKEMVVGFAVIEASDLDAALAIGRANPIVGQGGGVEIRPIVQGGPASQG
jgi:hypothetical protein